MIPDGAWPLQETLIAIAAAALDPIQLYNHVPPEAMMPYVAIGEISQLPGPAKDGRGSEFTATFHCWSAYRGKKEISEEIEILTKAFDGAALAVPGFDCVSCRKDTTQSIIDADGLTYHGIAVFKIVLDAQTA